MIISKVLLCCFLIITNLLSYTWVRYEENPIITVTGVPGEWDAGGAAAKSCILVNNQYHLFYQGDSGNGGSGSISIGKATSPDLFNWTKYPNNPVLSVGSSGSWDSYFVGMPSVIKIGYIWYMFYEGNNGIHSNIGLAISTDGNNFTKINYGINGTSKILEIGALGSWDDNNVGTPTILRASFKSKYRYLMYYTAQRSSNLEVCTGVAYSNNLINWVKEPMNPILTPRPNYWDKSDITCSNITIDWAGNYTMYYCAKDTDWKIGTAFSTDGKTWIRNNNPIFVGSGSGWDSNHVQLPLVPMYGYMIYSGAGAYYQIGISRRE